MRGLLIVACATLLAASAVTVHHGARALADVSDLRGLLLIAIAIVLAQLATRIARPPGDRR